MTDTIGSLLSGIGLFMCIGAIILVALVVFAIRAMTGPRGGASTMWNRRGTEQPRYDDPNITTTGGFGGVPTTGPLDNQGPFDNQDSGGFGGSTSAGPSTSAGFGGGRRGNQADDDNDIKSSGGFGKG